MLAAVDMVLTRKKLEARNKGKESFESTSLLDQGSTKRTKKTHESLSLSTRSIVLLQRCSDDVLALD